MNLKFELMVAYLEDIIFLPRDFIMFCCLGSWIIYWLVQTEGLQCFQFTYEIVYPVDVDIATYTCSNTIR